MDEYPAMALSIRQPWAHCIVAGWKNIENRTWRRGNPGLNFRGPFAIHAAMGMTRDEYDDCADLCAALGFACPAPAELLRGGIVGVATLVDIITDHQSPWFFGPKGLVLSEVRPVNFIAVGGRLGFFEWKKLLPYRKTDKPVEPAKWMLPPQANAAPTPRPITVDQFQLWRPSNQIERDGSD